MICPDGLVATPMLGRSYFRPSIQKLRFSGFSGNVDGDQIIDVHVNALMLGAVAGFALLDGREFWEPIGRRIVDGLARLALNQRDQAYYPQFYFGMGEQPDPSGPRPTGTMASFAMWPARRLIDFHRATGYEPALELAGRLCHYMPQSSDYFGPNLEFLPDNRDPQSPRYHIVHFHHHSMTLLTCLEYALAAGDQQILDFASHGFDKAKTYGECHTGFFPESAAMYSPQTCEICEVGDMIRIAVRLASTGLGDQYWDDVDCWVRNQLAEGQLVRHDWIQRLHLGEPPSNIESNMTTDRVAQRNLGAFGGWLSPNDWIEFQRRGEVHAEALGHVQGIMHCCTASGTRALYDVWQNIVHAKGQNVAVNLLLNHANDTVQIDSHLPYVGQVDLHVKKDCTLSVRMPGWVQLSQVKCVVEEAPREVTFDGRYAQVGQVQANKTVKLSFPIAERTDRVTIRNQWYFLVRKGHDVVFIDPPGQLCPLYQRDHYRDNVTLWKKSSRFVAEQLLDW